MPLVITQNATKIFFASAAHELSVALGWNLHADCADQQSPALMKRPAALTFEAAWAAFQ